MVWPENVISIILAVVLGGAVGLERETKGKFAGLRTNILICLGAAVFTIISKQMGGGQESSLTRIAAGVVAGVGFLGAGAIIQDRGGIYGLTTAATIWMVASIGMACGAGFLLLAVTSTIIALIVLIGLTPLEKWVGSLRRKHRSKTEPSVQSKDNG